MKISILILTYNRSDILRELLMSLGDISYSPLEIIVTDNHSTDNTELMMRNEFPNIAYYIMDANIGVGARNVGMSNATGDIIITIDDDVIGIGDSEIKTIIRIFNAKPDIGAVCFRIVDYYTGKICNWCHHYKTEEFCNREFITDEKNNNNGEKNVKITTNVCQVTPDFWENKQ